MVDRRCRSIQAGALILVLALLGAACGSGGTEAGSTGDEGEDPAGAEAEEAEAMTTENGSNEDGTDSSPPAADDATPAGSATPTTSDSGSGSDAGPDDATPDAGTELPSDDVTGTTQDLRDAITTTVPEHPGFRIDLVIRPRAAGDGAAPDGLPTDLAAALVWIEGVRSIEPGQEIVAGDGTSVYAEVMVQLGAAQDPDRVAGWISEAIGDGYDISTVKRPSGPVPDRSLDRGA